MQRGQDDGCRRTHRRIGRRDTATKGRQGKADEYNHTDEEYVEQADRPLYFRKQITIEQKNRLLPDSAEAICFSCKAGVYLDFLYDTVHVNGPDIAAGVFKILESAAQLRICCGGGGSRCLLDTAVGVHQIEGAV